MTTKVECDQAGGTVKIPLPAAELVWEGGCNAALSQQKVRKDDVDYTIDSCNEVCH